MVLRLRGLFYKDNQEMSGQRETSRDEIISLIRDTATLKYKKILLERRCCEYNDVGSILVLKAFLCFFGSLARTKQLTID